jgi:hypothetical protein
MDDVDADNERHRLEELERRAKRHKARDDKAAAPGVLGDKERKRREHAARILGAQQQQRQQQPRGGSSHRSSSKSKPPPPSSSSGRGKHSTPSTTSTTTTGGSSIFQSLFAERALGFSISFAFRNAPPRPPVGPIFVGLGLEGELQKWTNYKTKGGSSRHSSGGGKLLTGGGGMDEGAGGMNAVEKNYHWKLHSDLLLWNGTLNRKVLPACAMDQEGCYTTSNATSTTTGVGALNDEDTKNGMEGVNVVGGGGIVGGGDGKGNKTSAAVTLPPEDEALINWKGSMGDTAMEVLTTKQDRARAAARLAISQGKSHLFHHPSASGLGGSSSTSAGGGTAAAAAADGTSSSSTFRLKKHHLQSRILDEKTPNFMKKTTYLTNDVTSVHRFTSLASTQVQRAKDMDMAIKEKRENYNVGEGIERGFREAADDHPSSNKTNKRKRVHPVTKQEVYALWDVPLLPDVSTWGHTFTHVVLDNPPRNVTDSTSSSSLSNKTLKNVPSGSNNDATSLKIPQLLNKAIVADVTKHASNARMECTVWVPSTGISTTTAANTTTDTATATTNAASATTTYSAVQKYDLDVIPLRDPSLPPVHHVWTIYLNNNEDGGKPLSSSSSYAGYHSIGSRVQLSLGRPVMAGGMGGKSSNITATTTTSKVSHRNMKEIEKKELEMKMTLVDADFAEKYGL